MRRVLPLALAGVGVYAAVAYGTAMFNSAPTHLVAQRVIPADQTIAAADPLPANPLPAGPVQVPGQAPISGTVGRVGTVGRDVLPADAAGVTRNLNDATTTAVVPSGAGAASTNPAAAGPLGSVPVVNNLPLLGALNSVPLQNVTGSGVLPTGGTGGLKNVAGLGGATLPSVNGTPLGGGLLP